MHAELLDDPRSFFEGESDLTVPLVVVALTAVLAPVLDLLVAVSQNPLVTGISDALTYYGGTMVASAAVEVGLALYFLVGFYGLGRLLGGHGSASATLAVVGWGFVPQLFEVVGVMLVVVPRIGAVPSPIEPAWTTYDLAVLVLLLVMLAVSAAIWYHGVAAVQGLGRWRAAAVVGVMTAPLFGRWYLVHGGTVRVWVDAVLVAGPW